MRDRTDARPAFPPSRFWFNLYAKLACISAHAQKNNGGAAMNSWWIKTDNAQLVLEMRDVPEPRPAAGEVIVRVRAAARVEAAVAAAA